MSKLILPCPYHSQYSDPHKEIAQPYLKLDTAAYVFCPECAMQGPKMPLCNQEEAIKAWNALPRWTNEQLEAEADWLASRLGNICSRIVLCMDVLNAVPTEWAKQASEGKSTEYWRNAAKDAVEEMYPGGCEI